MNNTEIKKIDRTYPELSIIPKMRRRQVLRKKTSSTRLSDSNRACSSTKKPHLTIRRYSGYKTRTCYVLLNYICIGLSGQRTKVNTQTTDYGLHIDGARDR